MAVAAAVLLGLGFVLQQRVAQQAPPEDSLSFRLFADLIGKPLWLAGIAAMVGGQILGAVALGAGDVTLVEPLLTTNLLFALVLARLLSAQQLGGREWGGAALLIAGVVAFIAATRPGTGAGTVAEPQNWIFIGLVLVIVAGLVALARRTSGSAQATTLAAAAGLLFGTQDGLTRAAMRILDGGGPGELLRSWLPYVVLAVAVVGLLLAQSAFEAAPLRASLPPITAAEPLVGIAYGITVFGERVRVAPPWLAVEAGGLAAMIVGVVLLARSHMFAPHRHRRHPQVQS
nr:DMT family transporter [Pseudonocardia acidicola]